MPVGVDGAAERADHALAYGRRALESQGVADGDDVLSDEQIRRFTERGGHESAGVDLDDRQVGRSVASDDLGGVVGAVVQCDGCASGVLQDVVDGEDMAFSVYDHTRTHAAWRKRAG